MTKLREIRKKKKIRVEEICKKLYISPRTYYYWEIGKSEPKVTEAIKLGKLLGVSIETLFN